MSVKISTKAALLEFLQANAGKVVTTDEIVTALKKRGAYREKWSQRLSELRSDDGYDIYNHHDRADLAQGQYLMPSRKPTRPANPRKKVTAKLRAAVVARDGSCQFEGCGLRDGDIDPACGRIVKLTADHVLPHSQGGATCLDNLQAMCSRHQRHKSNRYDGDGLNVVEALRTASRAEKETAAEQLAEWQPEAVLAAVVNLECRTLGDAVCASRDSDLLTLITTLVERRPALVARGVGEARRAARERFDAARDELAAQPVVPDRLAKLAGRRRNV